MRDFKIRVGSIIYLPQDLSTGIIVGSEPRRFKVRWLNDPDDTGIVDSWEGANFIKDCCEVLVP